jgi:hypothetical protein
MPITFSIRTLFHKVGQVLNQYYQNIIHGSKYRSDIEFRPRLLSGKQTIQNVYDRVTSQTNLYRKNDSYHIESTSFIMS